MGKIHVANVVKNGGNGVLFFLSYLVLARSLSRKMKPSVWAVVSIVSAVLLFGYGMFNGVLWMSINSHVDLTDSFLAVRNGHLPTQTLDDYWRSTLPMFDTTTTSQTNMIHTVWRAAHRDVLQRIKSFRSTERLAERMSRILIPFPAQFVFVAICLACLAKPFATDPRELKVSLVAVAALVLVWTIFNLTSAYALERWVTTTVEETGRSSLGEEGLDRLEDTFANLVCEADPPPTKRSAPSMFCRPRLASPVDTLQLGGDLHELIANNPYEPIKSSSVTYSSYGVYGNFIFWALFALVMAFEYAQIKQDQRFARD